MAPSDTTNIEPMSQTSQSGLNGSNKSSTAAETAERVVDTVTTASKDAYDTVVDQTDQFTRMMRDSVRNNPLLAVGIAFGAGLALSLLVKRTDY